MLIEVRNCVVGDRVEDFWNESFAGLAFYLGFLRTRALNSGHFRTWG